MKKVLNGRVCLAVNLDGETIQTFRKGAGVVDTRTPVSALRKAWPYKGWVYAFVSHDAIEVAGVEYILMNAASPLYATTKRIPEDAQWLTIESHRHGSHGASRAYTGDDAMPWMDAGYTYSAKLWSESDGVERHITGLTGLVGGVYPVHDGMVYMEDRVVSLDEVIG